ELGDGGEPEGDALERGLPEIARGRLEAQAADRTADVGAPAGTPLAAEEGQEGEVVVVRVAGGERVLVLVLPEKGVEPVVDVAAVRERAALQHAPVVDAVHEETRARLWPLRPVQHAIRARRPDHERRALPGGAARAEVGARAVDERRIPVADGLVAELWQAVRVEPERRQELLVPGSAREVEEARAGGKRHRRLRDLAGQPLVQVVRERDEPTGRAQE